MSKKDYSDRDYEVGKGKTPEHTRFKPGQSGNPKGRPKGSRNFETLFEEAMSSRLTVNRNGKRQKITTRQAVILKLAEQGLGGEKQALFKLVDLLRAHDEKAVEQAVEELSTEDADILERYLSRRKEQTDGQS